ncbi:melanocyte-stimulating hormone receptor-like [Oculina patagonica]
MNRTNVSHINCFFLSVHLDQTKDTFIASILTCILNAVFSLLTSTGNVIILHVIWKKRELHSPSFTLLFCLAASDLLVGVISQPCFVVYHIAELAESFSVYCTFRITHTISSYITCGMSLVTLSGISVDRLLALILHLRYNTIVTVDRILITVAFLWIVCITVVMLRFWISKWIIIPAVILLSTFLITTLSTLKIFQIVRRHRRQISQQQQSFQINTVNVLKCRKSAVTVLYVYGLFLLFYFPIFLTSLATLFIGYTLEVKIAYNYATSAVLINSCLNPLVYCWRIKEIRRAVTNLLRKT